MSEVTGTPVDQAANAAAGNASHNEAPPQNYTDGYSYEVPRPFLNLAQAASLLGMTLRSLERSVLGRWGNKLPDGWLARRMKTSEGDEWRILPPPGFRVKLNAATEYDTEPVEAPDAVPKAPPLPGEAVPRPYSAPPSLPHDAAGYYAANKRKQPWRPERHTLDQPTIVIDRTEEVEHLLRELVAAKSALAEERRQHLDDLRQITQLQSSMRLLEVNAAEQSRAKADLEAAKQELSTWRTRYEQLTQQPWWRRMFHNHT